MKIKAGKPHLPDACGSVLLWGNPIMGNLKYAVGNAVSVGDTLTITEGIDINNYSDLPYE